MIRLKKHAAVDHSERDSANEARLVAAETRAKTLFEKAEWAHNAIVQRDKENHWQASVNRLFLGEHRC